MRMNRGTIILIAALLVIIVAVVFVNNQQTNAPTATPTTVENTGPLLAGIDGSKVVRYEIEDDTSGNFTALDKDTGGAWHIDATNTLPDRDPDQSTINSTVGQIATVQYSNSFQSDQLSNFGLDKPSYTITVTTSDNKLYTVYVGSKSPINASYYAIVQQGAAPAATAEATAEATKSAGKRLFQSVQRAAATAAATAEATSAATSAAPPAAPVTAAATTAPLAQATAEATLFGTAESTAEVTPFPTANVVHNPGVTLTGSQTIYVVPEDVITTLSGWIAQPPYAPLPTPAPTEEITAEATAAPTAAPTKVAATAAVTAQPTAATTQKAASTSAATVEATAATSATAEATAAK